MGGKVIHLKKKKRLGGKCLKKMSVLRALELTCFLPALIYSDVSISENSGMSFSMS